MNPVTHFEILAGPGDDKQAYQKFYSDVFGWTIEPMPIPGDDDPNASYGTVASQGSGIGGAVDSAQDSAKVLIYIEVDDPAAYLEKVKAAGGSVVQDITVIPDMVTYATFRDPAGNEVGIVKSQS